MFCHKCGNQLPKGAGFCHKCGAKMTVDDTVKATPSIPVTPETQNTIVVSNSDDVNEAYHLLKSSHSRCPKIKDVSLGKLGIKVKGLLNTYLYIKAPGGKYRVSKSSKWWYYIMLFPLLLIDGGFVTEFFDSYDNVTPGLSLLCIAGCIVWFIYLLFDNKESKLITSHVNETLKIDYSFPLALLGIQILLNFALVVMCIIALVSY